MSTESVRFTGIEAADQCDPAEFFDGFAVAGLRLKVQECARASSHPPDFAIEAQRTLKNDLEP